MASTRDDGSQSIRSVVHDRVRELLNADLGSAAVRARMWVWLREEASEEEAREAGDYLIGEGLRQVISHEMSARRNQVRRGDYPVAAPASPATSGPVVPPAPVGVDHEDIEDTEDTEDAEDTVEDGVEMGRPAQEPVIPVHVVAMEGHLRLARSRLEGILAYDVPYIGKKLGDCTAADLDDAIARLETEEKRVQRDLSFLRSVRKAMGDHATWRVGATVPITTLKRLMREAEGQ